MKSTALVSNRLQFRWGAIFAKNLYQKRAGGARSVNEPRTLVAFGMLLTLIIRGIFAELVNIFNLVNKLSKDCSFVVTDVGTVAIWFI